ncbi:O-acetyltransferase OatA [mine drainage metagenome]|uniref:O-acetyltransferase OatA n=1 Tax=mine drainage metagenome TaxID=410659 RepID=A0A1J5T4Q7_9ZZZZ
MSRDDGTLKTPQAPARVAALPPAVSARRPHLPYLDGWRGIAILCVLLGHFSPYEEMGGIGVTVFFVLSGILMSQILFVDQMPLRLFYRRRLARIVPVFWLYIIVVFTVGALALNHFSTEELISSALFLRTYFPDSDIFHAAIPIHHLWSLNVEEHSYLFLSLLGLVALRFGERQARIVLSVSSLLCLVTFAYYKFHPPAAHSAFYLRTEVAAFPLLLSSALFMWFRRWPLAIPVYLPVASFLAAFALVAWSPSVFLGFVGISVLLALSVNTLHAAPVPVLEFLSGRILRWFGVCSYSIYIWQQPFFFLRRYSSWEYASLAGCIAALVLASASFYLFENPVRKRLGYGMGLNRHRPRASSLDEVDLNAATAISEKPG